MIFSPDASKPYGRPAARTLYELLTDRVRCNPDAVALLAPGRRPLTYSGLLEHVSQTVADLRTFGVSRNDRVALVLPNGAEMAAAFAAVAAGAACAPLNPGYRDSEFDFYLSDLNPRALIIGSEMNSPAREIAEARGIPVLELIADRQSPAGVFRLRGVQDGRGVPAHDGFGQPQDTALVLHTSGTTSRPKIVPLKQINLCSSGHNISLSLALKQEDRCLNVMPLFHIHGLIGAVLASLSAGASVACTPGFDAARFFEWMEEVDPTWYTAVPTMHQAVLAHGSVNGGMRAHGRLRFIRSCSASMPQRLLVELEEAFGTRVIESYGMTEASHQIASNPLAPAPRKLGSVGLAAGPDVAIMDEAGNLLPAGEVGEVVIRGPNVTDGYENNPKANQSSFTDGWFRTGDQGRFDSEGYLYLTGRLKEIINRGGEKIVPKEVDEILMQHPAVAQALAFAVPHPTLGEEVAAAVVLKKNAIASDVEIVKFVAVRLADFKVPKQLLIVNEIPKGPTGKPQRIGLASKLADQLALKREADFVGATNSLERQLSDIWKDLLKVDKVGVRDSFYALGGDSLALAVMMTAVEAHFHTDLPVERVLKSPTIETLAQFLQETSPSHQPAAETPNQKPIRDSVLGGLKNRLLQYIALYAPGYKSTRVWLHRLRGVSIGQNVSIGLSSLIETAYPRLVFIGNNVTIGMRTLIIAHLRDSTSQARIRHQHTIRIEDNAYIGPGVIILPNVTIGQGAVVSAGSVVSRSVPAHTLVRGNPAIPIAHCGVSLGGGVSYEEFLRHLRPITDDGSSTQPGTPDHPIELELVAHR
jgi:acyl-CoA synthetase (AMP-forming)/AMP-acid ligase II/acetyltransferase-like isoleucine patch superfamily enzyme/acyl carrier protein